MTRICYLMRGLPGSGKSTRARELALAHYERGEATYVLSADDFWVQNAAGEYRFDGRLIGEAHAWNQDRMVAALENGADAIVIDNCNVCREHAKPYVRLALEFDYEVVIVEPKTPWAFDLDGLLAHGSHNVPRHSLERMLRNWESDLTVASIMEWTRCASSLT